MKELCALKNRTIQEEAEIQEGLFISITWHPYYYEHGRIMNRETKNHEISLKITNTVFFLLVLCFLIIQEFSCTYWHKS